MSLFFRAAFFCLWASCKSLIFLGYKRQNVFGIENSTVRSDLYYFVECLPITILSFTASREALEVIAAAAAHTEHAEQNNMKR